jgi:trans-2,3-dihydro-3-hydroxyanthranilate isomerase
VRKVRFIQADVFSDSPFGGNPVVVVPDPGTIGDGEMQSLARGMGIAETVFVLPPHSADAAFALRCFTPTVELAYSGHGLLGAAFVMAITGRLRLREPVTDLQIEFGSNLHPVALTVGGGQVVRVATRDCPPRFGAVWDDVSRVAAALSIDAKSILHVGLPVQRVETALPTLVVPVETLEALRAVVPIGHAIDAVLRDVDATLLLAFSRQTLSPVNDVHARVFAPPLGVAEDPASGAANGALAAYLVRHGASLADPVARLRSEQGTETGRPSLIELVVDASTDPFVVRVGGRVQRSIEGSVFY